MVESNTVRFTVTEAMVQTFARLTGDFNSLHMDEDVARKSRYRRRIVHGMLPFSFLQLLERSFPGQRVRFEKLRVRFRQPVHTGDTIDLEIEVSGVEFKANWRKADTQELVTVASGRVGLYDELENKGDTQSAGSDSGPRAFLVTNLDEALLGVGDLAERVESFELCLDPKAIADYADTIWSAADGEPPRAGSSLSQPSRRGDAFHSGGHASTGSIRNVH